MTYLAIGISVLIVGLGALGVASPERLLSIVRRYETPGGLRVSAVVRVVLGVALFLAAPTSRAPDLIRVFGVISVAAGLTIPSLCLVRIGKMVDWWAARPAFVFRGWSMVALAIGLYLVWALVPN
jgi:hypothetical protein